MKVPHALLLTVHFSSVGALDGSIKLRGSGHLSRNLRTSSDEVAKEGTRTEFTGARIDSEIPEEAGLLLRNRLLSDRKTVWKIARRNNWRKN